MAGVAARGTATVGAPSPVTSAAWAQAAPVPLCALSSICQLVFCLPAEVLHPDWNKQFARIALSQDPESQVISHVCPGSCRRCCRWRLTASNASWRPVLPRRRNAAALVGHPRQGPAAVLSRRHRAGAMAGGRRVVPRHLGRKCVCLLEQACGVCGAVRSGPNAAMA